ncbi:MAG: YgiT-type zinc finger protein [Desulfobacteraceae bacterium]|nr:YgiT-type zinc finger protein [Desulfobacteraceae bacterium]
MSTQLKTTMDWIKGRVKETAYFHSEHMVRYLTQRLFSIEEIESVLLDGKILEIHSHPLRNDCYLILGYSYNKPIHVMCTKDKNGNLIILYAYLPANPTWKDEKTRTQSKGQTMDGNLKKCFFCNSEIEPITVGNFDFRWEGDLYVIKGVPAGLCVQCGEKYISADASKKIVAKIEQEDFTGKDEVLIFEYKG